MWKIGLVLAKELAQKYTIPLPDAVHAIVSQDNDSLLVTQDNHLLHLKDIIHVAKPDELI